MLSQRFSYAGTEAMADKYSEPYYRPHPKTRLAFDARGVFYLCNAPVRTVANDPNKRRLYETAVRMCFEGSFPDLPKAALDTLAAQEVQLATLRSQNSELRGVVARLLRKEDIRTGSQPRRPHTLIIGTKVDQLHSTDPTATPHALWLRAAEHFAEGHPTTGNLGALDVWGIRSAYAAYRDLTLNSDRTGALIAKMKRRERLGRPHDWDRNIWDFSKDAEWLAQNAPFPHGLTDDEVFAHTVISEVHKPLAAMDLMYRQAIGDPRFRGLRGERLADRIDELFGFEATVDKIVTKQDLRDMGIPEADFIPSAVA